MDDFLQSHLRVDPNLGMPASFSADRATSAQGPVPLDLSGSQAGVVSAAPDLMGKTLYGLYRNLGPDDYTHVEVRYAVEKVGVSISTANQRAVVINYPTPPKESRTMLCYRGVGPQYLSYSPNDAKSMLASYGHDSITQIDVGVSREQHHYRVHELGRSVEATLLAMWLVHLDVVKGSHVEVVVDPRALRANLPLGLQQHDEREFAKGMSGLRLHVNSANDVTKALLVIACDRDALVGGSEHLTRYNWPFAQLVFYGGVAGGAQRTDLNDPDATARAILSFAEAFAQPGECSRALQTAMVLYGLESCANKLVLDVSPPSLHEGVHRKLTTTLQLHLCRELASRELVSTAMWAGRAFEQACGQTLRASILAMGAVDSTNADVMLDRHQPKMLEHAGSQAMRQWNTLVETSIAGPDYIRLNLAAIMAKRGIVHALILGMYPTNTMIDSATSDITLGQPSDTAVTDDPSQALNRRQAAVDWLIVSELLTNAGEALGPSRQAVSRGLLPGMRLHSDIRHFACSVVRFTVLSMSDYVTLDLDEGPYPYFHPDREDAEDQIEREEFGPKEYVAEVVDKLPQVDEQASWFGQFLDARGPVASTTMRGTRTTPAMGQRTTDVQEVIVGNSALVNDAKEAFSAGWGPEPTSGAGLECGAHAVHQSLCNVLRRDGGSGMLYDAVLHSVRSAFTPAQAELSNLADVTIGPNDFSLDQLAQGLQRLGPYRLGVVERQGPGHIMHVHGAGNGRIIPIHHEGHHWQSIGPNGAFAFAVR